MHCFTAPPMNTLLFRHCLKQDRQKADQQSRRSLGVCQLQTQAHLNPVSHQQEAGLAPP